MALLLIKAGADVNQVNHAGNAALHFLARRREGNDKQQAKNTMLYLMLRNNKSTLQRRNEAGNSALQLAIESGNHSIVTLLLQEKTVLKTLNQLNFSGNAALHIAVKNIDKLGINQLIKAKANIDQRDNNGDTALHLASERMHTEIIKQLLDAGARTDIKNYSRETVLDKAVRGRNKIIIEMLSGDVSLNH